MNQDQQPIAQMGNAMLLTGAALFETIQRTLRGERALCAVAFWGDGSERLFTGTNSRDRRIICNLAMGGTNPHAIRRLLQMGVKIRQYDTLHAKLYIGDTEAVLTSANASLNGLGLGSEAGLVEAGCVIPAEATLRWFEELWHQSREIQAPDLDAALVKFIRTAKISKDNVSLGMTLSDKESTEPLEIRSIYDGISVTQASSLVLSVHQQPMTVPEITAELEAGGLRTAASRLFDSVHNAVQRGAERKILGRASRGYWGLLGWPGIVPIDRKPRDQISSRIRRNVMPKDIASSERTLAGLAAARQRGVRGGSPGKLSDQDRIAALAAMAAGEKAGAVARRFGVTIQAMYKLRRTRGTKPTLQVDPTE